MLVYGMLEKAQFETFTNAGKPSATSYAYRVIWISDLSQLYVSDGANWLAFSPANSSRLAVMYDIVIGSAAQVTSGVATHSTWASAISAASAGATVYVLPGTWAENVSIDKRLNITGSGYGSYINGTLTFTSSSDYSMFRQVRVSGNITLNSGADGNFVKEFWLGSTSSVTDNGTANLIEAIQE